VGEEHGSTSGIVENERKSNEPQSRSWPYWPPRLNASLHLSNSN